MITVNARDVVGTGRANALVAVGKLDTLLSGVGEHMSDSRRLSGLKEIADLITEAASDILLAQHMMSGDWSDTTYVGRWSNDKEED